MTLIAFIDKDTSFNHVNSLKKRVLSSLVICHCKKSLSGGWREGREKEEERGRKVRYLGEKKERKRERK